MLEVRIFESDQDYMNTLKKMPELKGKRIRRIKYCLKESQRIELLEVAQAKNYKHYLMIEFLLLTGLRVNELCNILISDLNLREGYVEVQTHEGSNDALAFEVKTLFSNRQVVLARSLVKELIPYVANRKAGYLFESEQETKHKGRFLIRSVIDMINSYAKQCKSIGRTIGAHAMRRTYASYLIISGIPMDKVSRLLGHTEVRTTLIYLLSINNLDNYEDVKDVLGEMNRPKKKKKEKHGG